MLEKINKLVKWDRINKKLISKYKKSASADGRPAYPAIVMFKVLLLQRMYNLSDPQMEACLKDRISFFQFVGLSIKHLKPDHLREGLKNLNKAISKIRYKVERTIGMLKRLYGFNRLRYVEDKKSDMEFYLSAMVYNLRKAGLKLEAVKS